MVKDVNKARNCVPRFNSSREYKIRKERKYLKKCMLTFENKMVRKNVTVALHQAYDQHGDNRRVAERNSNKQHFVKLEGGISRGRPARQWLDSVK